MTNVTANSMKKIKKKKTPRPEPEIGLGATPYLLTDRGQKNQHYKPPKRGGFYNSSPPGPGSPVQSSAPEQPFTTGIDEYIADSPRSYNAPAQTLSPPTGPTSASNTSVIYSSSPPRRGGRGVASPTGRGGSGVGLGPVGGVVSGGRQHVVKKKL